MKPPGLYLNPEQRFSLANAHGRFLRHITAQIGNITERMRLWHQRLGMSKGQRLLYRQMPFIVLEIDTTVGGMN